MPPPAATLQKALKTHQAGGIHEAQRLYRRVLAADPRNPDALHLLGVAALQTGRAEEAEELIRKALRHAPERAEFHNALGEVFATRLQFDDAVPCFQEAVRLAPGNAEAHNNLGLCYHAQHRPAAALKCFYRAMQLRPDFAEPFNHAGIIAFREHQPDQACLFFQKAIRLKPDYAEAIGNLGLVHLAQDRLAEAAACFHNALRLKPNYAPAHNSLGIVHQKNGHWSKALACFHEAIRCDPQSAEAHNNAGNALRSAGRMTEALAYYQKALQLNPYHYEAQTNLSLLLCEQGRHTEAIAGFEEALTRAPCDALRLLSLLTLPVIYDTTEDVLRHRRRFEANLVRLAREKLVIDDPVRQIGNLVFYLAYQGMNDRQAMADLAELFGRAAPMLHFTAPHCLAPDAADDRPIRLGFISNHFFNHTIARLNGGIIRELARNPRFHVTVFSLQARDDEWANFVRESGNNYLVLPSSLADARLRIADERLDVLYYTDIGMAPATYYLAFARLAPVQCVTWGHPNTTGLPTMDYFLSARDLDPEDGDNQYTERLVRMENLNTYFYPLPNVPLRPRGHFGLAEDEHVYACPQSLFKFHPGFDDYLGEILRRDPRGRLVLIAGHHEYWQTLLLNRFGRNFGAAAERVLVLPRLSSTDFLSLLALADAILDPLPFGGGLSSHEAFLVGSPVVTQPVEFLRGRITYACYRCMGLMHCVAANREEYVDIALRLANDRDWREDVRARLVNARGVLLENRGVIRELEEFLPAALRRAAEGRSDASSRG
jgi:predicted O-linked N-acetylglucosamine transferase (SPINDLY family)